MTSSIHGGNLVVRSLIKHNVKHVFTLCGGHISPILVGCEQEDITVIDTRHEVTAVFAAEGVSRLTGIPGVAIVTAGPGVTNTITAIKNAQMAQTPLILIGGSAATLLKGRGSLQDIDQIKLMKSLVKWSKTIKKVKNIIPILDQAFKKSMSGIPGPVFIEIPIDLLYPEQIVRKWHEPKKVPNNLFQKITNKYIQWHLDRQFSGNYQETISTQLAVVHPTPSNKQIKQFLELISISMRPVMVIGGQTVFKVFDVKETKEAIENLNIPCYLSGKARGLIEKDNSLLYRHKRREALKSADLVILLGVPMDFRLDYGRIINSKANLVRVNRDISLLRQNSDLRRAKMTIKADPAIFLQLVSKNLSANHEEWIDWKAELQKNEELREKEILGFSKDNAKLINPVKFFIHLKDKLPEKTIIIADGGDFISTMSYIIQPNQPLKWMDPGPFGTLGTGAGFAIAAKLCNPDYHVFLFYGDGSIGFSLSEFDTFIRHNIPILAIVGNDGAWSQIAREQISLFGSAVSTKLKQSEYHKVVEGFKGKGILIKTLSEVYPALESAYDYLLQNKAVLLNVLLDNSDFRKGSISM